MKESKLKLLGTKKKAGIVTGLLVLLSVFGGGAYAYVDHQNTKQQEQERMTVKLAEEAIVGFYADESKIELAIDLNEEKFVDARKSIGAVNDDKRAELLTRDLEEAKILWHAQESVQGFLEDGILIEDADGKQMTNLSKLIIEVKGINKVFADALNQDVKEIKKQYESLTTATENVFALFLDEAQESVNKEVTRDQFKVAKRSLESILNEKEKTKLHVLLTSVEADLVLKEKAKVKASTPTREETKPKGPSATTYINGVLIASKKYPLPANHAPGESKEARSAFNQLAAAAKKEGFALTAFSTYRSYEYQIGLFDRYVQQNGEKEANRYSARPGESEHQTGLAFDVGEVGQEGDWARQKFGNTAAGQWLAKNAHHSGFIIRYPEGKEVVTGYIYEPWHLRYVGVALATKIYNSGSTLEEYVGA